MNASSQSRYQPLHAAPAASTRAGTSGPELSEYEQKLRREQDHFGGVANIHDLPPIFHYWSNKYIRPLVEEFGFTLAEELYAKYLASDCKAGTKETPVFSSVGAGDGEPKSRSPSYCGKPASRPSSSVST